jgi:hypothetical protein
MAFLEENVLGLKAAMYYVAFVRLVERFGNIVCDAYRVSDRELLLSREPFAQSFALTLSARCHYVVLVVDILGGN